MKSEMDVREKAAMHELDCGWALQGDTEPHSKVEGHAAGKWWE